MLPFDVEFNPAGMEGHIEKRVWVTLAPSKKIVAFDIAADVRLRLGIKPMDAAFGVIKRSDTGREITYRVKGGIFNGSFKAYMSVGGKPKALTVNVTGVLIGGKGYGSATIKRIGSVPVTIE